MNFIGSAAALLFGVGVVVLVALGFARAMLKGI
jgi:hypothetical protein